MSEAPFDPERIDLERMLQSRRGAEPSAALRDRTLRSVASALSERPRISGRARWPSISELPAAAAVLLIALTLSRLAASATSYEPRVEASAAATCAEHDAAALLRDVVPGLTESEANQLARTAARASPLPPVPLVRGRTVEPITFNAGELR